MSKQENSPIGTPIEDSSVPGELPLDKVKLDHLIKTPFRNGYSNFILYQHSPDFRWPVWLKEKLSRDTAFGGSYPPILVNDIQRDRISFNNLLSEEELYIDQSGMVSTSYGRWSLELWILSGNRLFHPSDNLQQIKQRRDPFSASTETRWEEKAFVLRQNFYGARSDVDESIMTVDVTLKTGSESVVLFNIRPYNLETLGGVESVEYSDPGGTVSINGRKLIYCPTKPDFILAGKNDRDINLDDQEDCLKSRSVTGLAALTLGFRLKKGENSIHCRISLSPRGITGGKFDIAALKNDFNSFSTLRLRQGAMLSMQDKEVQRWFAACKMNTLMFSGRDRYRGQDPSRELDYRFLFFAVSGFNRMGFFQEARDLLEFFSGRFTAHEKKVGFTHIIDGCYLLCAFADLFTHVRDIEYLQARFERIKAIARILFSQSVKVKGHLISSSNSIEEYCIREGHPLDTVLLSDALDRFSYLARCLGIFGDEIKFKKESDRLFGFVTSALEEGGGCDLSTANFLFYLMHALYPHRSPNEITSRRIMKTVLLRYGDLPLYVKPFGVDIFNTLIGVNALVQLKDQRVYQIIAELMKIAGERYSFPQYANPASGRGSYGAGASKITSSLMFTALRFLLFIDYPERLEIFPVPHRDWFKPGAEITADNLPSRFGLINFRVVSTSNEIQIFFDKLPKFVPPEIVINMPVKTSIHDGDDFIIKREEDLSFVINGWPSIVRFIRK